MHLIDTHVHLEDEAFAPDREAVLQRAAANGISTLLNAGSAVAANKKILELVQQIPNIYGSIGLHPHEFPGAPEAAFKDMREQLCREKIVAIGEIGLDYHVFPDYPPPDREAQQKAFGKQLEIAKLFELPLIVHVREAYQDALRCLKKYGPFPNGGVMHCYAGGVEHLSTVLDMGFYIGIGGPVTYPKAEDMREVVRQVPADRLLLETDAPYLPPQFKRGKRNEPAYVKVVAEACAKQRNVLPETLAEQTTTNARRLFKLADSSPGTFVYDIQGHLYINLTNRCSAECTFCPRRVRRQVQQYDLSLSREPLAEELIAGIGDPTKFAEVVFCGFGEPVLRLPILLQVAKVIKARGGRVRVDTNGHADIIFGRDILADCLGVVDEWSISLNSADPEQYTRLVRPQIGFNVQAAVIDFISRAVKMGFPVSVTAVELTEVNTQAVQQLAESLGARYRGRVHQRLGEPEKRS